MKNIQNQQMTARKSPTNLQSKTKFAKQRNSKASGPTYKCARCSMVIFGQSDLVDHHDLVFLSSSSLNSSQNPAANVPNAMGQSIMGQKSTLAKCACLFLKMTDWMQRAGVKQYHSGFIECPNEQCQTKLGQYSLNGLKCNCGQSITPAYQIFKSKIRLSDHPVNITVNRTVPQDHRTHVRSNFDQNSRTLNTHINTAQQSIANMSMTNYAQFNARSHKKTIPKNSDSLTRFSHGPAPGGDPFIAPPISQGTANNTSQMSQNQGYQPHLVVNGHTGIITYRNHSGGGIDPPDQIMKSIMKRQSHGVHVGAKDMDMHIDKMIQERI